MKRTPEGNIRRSSWTRLNRILCFTGLRKLCALYRVCCIILFSFYTSMALADFILLRGPEFTCNLTTVHTLPSTTPNVTVRFSNPQYDCIVEEYCVNVEFQSDLDSQEIFGMNVRFFYDDDILELIDFRDYQGGYGPVAPNPPVIATSGPAGPGLFNFSGPADFVNGAIQLIDENFPPIYISTTGWTKLFQVCFSIDDPNPEVENFCPSLVWDLEADPLNGGFLTGDDGVVITVLDSLAEESLPVFEHVQQFNWEYIGDGSPPYGQPIQSHCISISCGPVITCPVDVTVGCGESTDPTDTGTATAFDYCEGDPVISFLDTIYYGTCGSESYIWRIWTAMDSCGNESSCIQVISLNYTGTICGSVIDDLGDPIGDVELHLYADVNENEEYDAGDTLLQTTFSDSVSGYYCFANVPPCMYIISEIQPAGYGDNADYDHSPDPDGDDSQDGPDNQIPVTLDTCEIDNHNNFLEIVCPAWIPVMPFDTICESASVSIGVEEFDIGPVSYLWSFGSGSDPDSAMGPGFHTVSYMSTMDNQETGAVVELIVSKAGCPDLTGEVTRIRVNSFPDASIEISSSPVCYYTDQWFQPTQDELPGASYQWEFGEGSMPSSGIGYGPHAVQYQTQGNKTSRLTIFPNQEGAQCPDSSTISFNVLYCPGQILGFVMSESDDPIPGVNLRLFTDANTDGVPDNNTPVRSVFSTGSGSYSMASVTPGHYVIKQIQPAGWYSVTDVDESDDGDEVPNTDSLDNLIPLSLLAGEIDSMNYFIERPIPGEITGYVFDDYNSNQQPDPDEGIDSVRIYLFADADTDGIADSETPLDSQWTDMSGMYLFEEISVGHYVLEEINPPDYASVLDVDMSNDEDVVPNTDMHNDTIPVSITNQETDAHNYFIDVILCNTYVTNAADSGLGTLRNAINCADSGDTILFHSTMEGETIEITSTLFAIDKDLHIICSFSPRVSLHSQISGFWEILPDAMLELKGLEVVSGLSMPGNGGAAFKNQGILKLYDVDVRKNTFLAPDQYLIRNYDSSELILSGNSGLEED